LIIFTVGSRGGSDKKIDMKKTASFSIIIVITLFLFASTDVKGQFVTIARKIKSMRTSDMDVATVILDARTFKVHKAVVDTLTSSPKIKILKQDPVKRQVEFTNGINTLSIQVDSLDIGLSQITVAAAHSGQQQKKATDVAVEVILGVCHKAGIKCTVE
jgi:hypothetical protein